MRTSLEVDESVTVAAQCAFVWRALADPQPWWPGLRLDARPGGRFEERWSGSDGRPQRTAGEVLVADAPSRLVLVWADDGWPAVTRVEITLSGQTVVRVLHTGWEALPDPPGLAAAHRVGWRRHLRDLAEYVAP